MGIRASKKIKYGPIRSKNGGGVKRKPCSGKEIIIDKGV